MTTIITESRFDKFGFYQTQNQRFYSKFEAIYHCPADGKITWQFNSDVYDACDWTQDPPVSLAELYRARAQQIRDQYDYVVLCYSGGADSNNILNAFVDNDIKIDDLATFVNYEATGNKLNWLNAEIFHVAIPLIERARIKQPDIRHTMVDMVQITKDTFGNKSAKFDWIYDVNKFINPYNASKRNLKLSQPHWAKLIAEGKRVCFIHGTDKPLVTTVKDRYYFRFYNTIDTAVPPSIQRSAYDWEFDELFYWTPDLPQLVIKQAHVIQKYLKQAPLSCSELSVQKPNAQSCSKTVNNHTYYLSSDQMHRLIYPGWYPVPYQWKPKSIVFTPRDEWIYSLPDDDLLKYSWRTGLDELWKATPDSHKSDPTKMDLGFKTMYSKPYYLGT